MTTLHPVEKRRWRRRLRLFYERRSGCAFGQIQGLSAVPWSDWFGHRGILNANEAMASRGLRVLAVAMRRWTDRPSDVSPENMESGLTFIGLVGMMDPPREEAKEAIRLCKSAGIAPVMITGDHPITAGAIARRLGIIDNHHGTVMTGRELAKLTR
jgi:magnesium-transporting ATPase (P-type)